MGSEEDETLTFQTLWSLCSLVTDPQLLAQDVTPDKLVTTTGWIKKNKQKAEDRALEKHRHLKANKEDIVGERERRKQDG